MSEDREERNLNLEPKMMLSNLASLAWLLILSILLIQTQAPADAADSRLKDYINHVRGRVQESWSTYEVNGVTASVSLSINPAGQISSTRLLKSSGPDEDVQKTVEAIRYATPFGKPPTGQRSLSLNVEFRQSSVVVNPGSGGSVTASRVTAKAAPAAVNKSRRPAAKSPTPAIYLAHPASISHTSSRRYETTQSAKEFLDYLQH